MRITLLGIAAAFWCAGCQPPAAPPQTGAAAAIELPHTEMTITGGAFDIKEPAEGDLSGLACRPAASPTDWNCLVINDELTTLQLARVDGDTIFPGAPVSLPAAQTAFGEAPRVVAAGEMGGVHCPAKDEPDEMDWEAISYDAGYFYVVGSHGCSRNKFRFDHFGFRVTRFRLDEAGVATDAQYSYRLSEALSAAGGAGEHFGGRLQPEAAGGARERGLNIEGAVASGNMLLVGLRAPTLSGDAFVIGAPISVLFSGASLLAPLVRRIALTGDAASEVGIRDMALLANGDLLVLGGPTEEQSDVRYGLYRVGADNGVHAFGVLAPTTFEGGKAEAVLLRAEDASGLDLVVLFDGPPTGEPRRYRIAASDD